MASNKKALWIVLGAVGSFLLLACFGVAVLIWVLAPAVQKVRQRADQTQKLNNLSQIGKTIHFFHDSRGHMPTKPEDLQPFGGDPGNWHLFATVKLRSFGMPWPPRTKTEALAM